MKQTILAITLAAALLSPARAQSPEDTTAIKATALDYIEGWYEGNAERMERVTKRRRRWRVTSSTWLAAHPYPICMEVRRQQNRNHRSWG